MWRSSFRTFLFEMSKRRSASKRHGYTAVVLRLRVVSDAPRQLACGSPSAVQRGWQAAWAERAKRLNNDHNDHNGKLHGLSG
jgi:hypothetical protein